MPSWGQQSADPHDVLYTESSTSHHMLCVQCGSVCVRVLLCLVFIIAVHLGNKVISSLPVMTADTKGHSYFLLGRTDHLKSLSSAGGYINLRNKSLKYRRNLLNRLDVLHLFIVHVHHVIAFDMCVLFVVCYPKSPLLRRCFSSFCYSFYWPGTKRKPDSSFWAELSISKDKDKPRTYG